MANIILQGALLGLILSVLIGATFFVLIETSISHGVKNAISMSLGVFLSDALILLIIWNTSRNIIEKVIANSLFNTLGAIIFVLFGIYYLYSSRNPGLGAHPKTNKSKKLFLQGILINTLNPSVTAFWLGAMFIAISKLAFSAEEIMVYFGSALFVILSVDLIKIYLASKLKAWITTKRMKIIYLVIGFIFVAMGLKILLDRHSFTRQPLLADCTITGYNS